MEVRDPIAELADELAKEAETQAKATAGKDDEDEAADDEAGKDDAEQEAKADDAEAQDKTDAEQDPDKAAQDEVEGKKAKDRSETIPRARLDEEYAKRRRAERIARENSEKAARLEKELEEVRKAKPADGKTPDQIREEIRAEEHFKLQVNQMTEAGNKNFGEKEFDEAADRLTDLGAPGTLVNLALAATDTPSAAARAIFMFGQQTPEEIERVLALPPLKQATYLARMSTQRAKNDAKERDEEDDKPARTRAPLRTPPKPIKPLGGKEAMTEGFGDDVPDEIWGERFNKEILGIGTRQ